MEGKVLFLVKLFVFLTIVSLVVLIATSTTSNSKVIQLKEIQTHKLLEEGTINVTPYPAKFKTDGRVTKISPSIKISCNLQSKTFDISIKRYENLFFPFKDDGTKQFGDPIELEIEIKSSNEDLVLGIDESYTVSTTNLDQKGGKSKIVANTIYGGIRALETFKQLITYEELSSVYSIQLVEIQDSPRFKWRGFMIDTSRHFQPKKMIFKMIDSIGYNKFNVLHWHLVDTESFPVVSKTYPKLTDGAWSPRAIYTHEDIQEIVGYAKTWGIRVVPEFDVPGHARSWGKGYPQLVATCPKAAATRAGGGTLNPALPFTYEFLENFFIEMSELFPDAYFHTGADEVVYECWIEDPQINKWMSENNFSTGEMAEQYFQDKLDKILEKIKRKKIVWNDPFDKGLNITKDTLIHVWHGKDIEATVKKGFKAIYSSNWYLDRQLPTGTARYFWMETWLDFYLTEPTKGLTDEEAPGVLGGEAPMWSEQVNQINWDVRVWPRACAIAERLWSDKSINNPDIALPRIGKYSCDLSRRGIASGPMAQDYCWLPDDLVYKYEPAYPIDKNVLLEIYKSINR
eukprot:gene2929-3650_t